MLSLPPAFVLSQDQTLKFKRSNPAIDLQDQNHVSTEVSDQTPFRSLTARAGAHPRASGKRDAVSSLKVPSRRPRTIAAHVSLSSILIVKELTQMGRNRPAPHQIRPSFLNLSSSLPLRTIPSRTAWLRDEPARRRQQRRRRRCERGYKGPRLGCQHRSARPQKKFAAQSRNDRGNRNISNC